MHRPLPHSGNLRRGRWSQPGQIYLLTLVTKNRIPVFADFAAARSAARCLAAPTVREYGTTLAYVVMPDHIHWLLQLADGASVSNTVRVYRARVSLAIGQRVWQRGFHDRALRRDEDLLAVARYLVANPLRAGLAERLGDYPYWDAVWL